jgi:hypothetical protein
MLAPITNQIVLTKKVALMRDKAIRNTHHCSRTIFLSPSRMYVFVVSLYFLVLTIMIDGWGKNDYSLAYLDTSCSTEPCLSNPNLGHCLHDRGNIIQCVLN